jgi:creatinine amidohydrolase
MNDSLELEKLRYPAIAKALEAGVRTAVFACGAVEQHGPHLPLFVDAEHGTRLAVEVAGRLGNALVAPTIRIGCSDHHMAFAGSLTIRKETFQALVRDYCASLAHHGFDRICIIPSHGGNFGPLTELLPRLREEFGGVRVQAFVDILVLMEVWRETVEEVAGLGARVGGHADIAETAILLALHPDRVRNDLAEEGYETGMRKEEFDRIISEGFSSVTPNGILGDARGATAEMGDALIAALADRIAGLFQAE